MIKMIANTPLDWAYSIARTLRNWQQIILQFTKEASHFYYRLATNKAGLPRWLWVAMLVSWVLIATSLATQGLGG